jgi:hypothetical protein
MASTWFVDGSVRDPNTLSDFLVVAIQGWQYTPSGIYSYPDPLCWRVAQTLAAKASLQAQEYAELTNFEQTQGAGLWECVQYCISNIPGVVVLTSAAFQGVLQGYIENVKQLPPGVFAIAQYLDDAYPLNISDLPPSPNPQFSEPKPTSLSYPSPDPPIAYQDHQIAAPISPARVQSFQLLPESLSVAHAKLRVSEIAQAVKGQLQQIVTQSVKLLETRLQSSLYQAKAALDSKLQSLSQALPQPLSLCSDACKQSLGANPIQTFAGLPDQLKQVPTVIAPEDDARLQACRDRLELLQGEVQGKQNTYSAQQSSKMHPKPLAILDTRTEQGSFALQLLVANFLPGTLQYVTVFGKLQSHARQTMQVVVDIAPGISYVSVVDDQLFNDCASAEFSLWIANDQGGNIPVSEPYLLTFNEAEPAPPLPVSSSIPPLYFPR